MIKLKLLQLEYFETVCKYESINKAAEALHVSQPAITKAIQQLESEFDIALFYRTGNHISLTEEGQFFLRYCSDINARVSLLEERMHQISSDKHSIRIGFPPMTEALLYPNLYQHVHKRYPNLNLEVVESGSGHLAELINDADANLDMALVLTDIDLSPLFNVIHIYDTEMVLCTGPSSSLADYKSISIADLGDTPLVLLQKGSFQYDALGKLFSYYDVDPNVILYSNQLLTITNMVRNNIASAFVIKEFAQQQHDLVSIPLEDTIPIRIDLIWNKRNYLPAQSLKLLHFLQKHYNSSMFQYFGDNEGNKT